MLQDIPKWFLLRLLVDSPGATAVEIPVLAERALCSRGSVQGRSWTLVFSGPKLGSPRDNASKKSISAEFPVKTCSSFPAARFVTCGYPTLKHNLDSFRGNFRMPWSRKDWGSKHHICPFHFLMPHKWPWWRHWLWSFWGFPSSVGVLEDMNGYLWSSRIIASYIYILYIILYNLI